MYSTKQTGDRLWLRISRKIDRIGKGMGSGVLFPHFPGCGCWGAGMCVCLHADVHKFISHATEEAEQFASTALSTSETRISSQESRRINANSVYYFSKVVSQT